MNSDNSGWAVTIVERVDLRSRAIARLDRDRFPVPRNLQLGGRLRNGRRRVFTPENKLS